MNNSSLHAIDKQVYTMKKNGSVLIPIKQEVVRHSFTTITFSFLIQYKSKTTYHAQN